MTLFYTEEGDIGRFPLVPILFGAGLIALILALIINVMTGPVSLAVGDVLNVLWLRLSGAEIPDELRLANGVVWELRLIRVLMALMVGACLATCGAAMQGLFGNPLADPGIIGVSSGASLGAVLVIVLNIAVFGAWTLPIGAFIAGTLTTFLIYALAQPGTNGDSSRLLLVGIAINAIAGAITGYFTYLASAEQLQNIVYWGMGSMSSASWGSIAILIPLGTLGIGLLMTRVKHLDILALGERPASHLGVDVKKLRLSLVLICALLVAAAVSFTGTIGFVGLVVPHLVRLVLGPSHKLLIPFSAIGGGLLLMVADLAARNLDPPNEIPIGILTASIGGPFFLWLIYTGRSRRSAS